VVENGYREGRRNRSIVQSAIVLIGTNRGRGGIGMSEERMAAYWRAIDQGEEAVERYHENRKSKAGWRTTVEEE